jgi:D-alanyl-lipoteichoic acid acyltransferase DltB (MBOAT superfamily)
VGAVLSGKTRKDIISRKTLIVVGVLVNLLLLAYYKYTDFFLVNAGRVSGLNFALEHLVLPLGISFFTFTQIAYLVDTYNKDVKEMDYLNYSLFVTFFPHLIAGPILHHSEMMPQFDDVKTKTVNYKNLALGIFLFSAGLFKKVMIADTFAQWANAGFAGAEKLTFVDGWTTSLSYTAQLYFDFSGYTDMALGIALMFNIRLPQNFNSPYKAVDLQDFWRRWHMTLSRFLRDYLYIPLGGNRKGELITCQNLMITFLLGGFWHGAAWTFVFWGFMHGAGLVINRFWRRFGFVLPSALAWFITFNYVNIGWVFFRAKSWGEAFSVLKAMSGLNGFVFPQGLLPLNPAHNAGLAAVSWSGASVLCSAAFILTVLFVKKTDQLDGYFKPKPAYLAAAVIMTAAALCNMSKVSEFLYYTF